MVSMLWIPQGGNQSDGRAVFPSGGPRTEPIPLFIQDIDRIPFLAGVGLGSPFLFCQQRATPSFQRPNTILSLWPPLPSSSRPIAVRHVAFMLQISPAPSVTSLILLFSSTFQGSCDQIEPTQIIQANPPILRSITLLCKSPFAVLHIHRFQGLECEHPWEP